MEHKEKEHTAKTIIKYSSSNFYKQLLSVFNAFIKPKLLSPEMFGLWNLLYIIPTYVPYIHLGSRYSMRYFIPYHEEKKELQKIDDLKGSVFYGTLYLNILAAAVIVIAAFTGNFNLVTTTGLIAMAALVLIWWYYEYYINYLKARQDFSLITSSNYLLTTVAFFSSLPLLYFFNIYGLYISAVLSNLAVIFYLRAKHPLGIKTGFRYSVFADLVKRGFPIMIFLISDLMIRTSDRIVVSYFLGNEQLGYYSIAIMVLNFVMQIPGASREVVESKLMKDAGSNSKEAILREYFFGPLVKTAYLMPLLLGPIVIVLPVLIPVLLPRYIQGIVSAQIVTLGCYFLSMSYTARGVLIANGLQLKAFYISVLVLIGNIALSIILLKSGLGIKGVAISCSISYFLLFIGFFMFIKKMCFHNRDDWKTAVTALSLPFPVMCGAIVLLNYISAYLSLNIFVSAVLSALIFYAVMLTVVNKAEKQYCFLKGIRLKNLWQEL
ncbi:MAG: oligosaccharide flippase family protein [Nitrospirae bacterium]|nr:oligosaccharide flippase family protein [Nitrospirota bacterium]